MDRAKRRFADDEDERSELGTPFISDDEGGIAQWVDDDLEPLQSDDDESSNEHQKSVSENEVRPWLLKHHVYNSELPRYVLGDV